MINAVAAATRQTAVFGAAMRHGNKIRPRAIAPGHRRIRDFSRSLHAVYGSGLDSSYRAASYGTPFGQIGAITGHSARIGVATG
jgi:hypothetical protein